MPAVLVESENLKLDADALVSEHVLVRDRRTYAFLHESIFDYVFARSYLAAGGRVVDLLAADEQDLFRRAQVRQLLVQQRDIDMVLYLEDLRDLLSRSDIRFHIKESVLSWLAGVSDPTAAEADVVRDALIDDRADPRSALAWRVLSQPAWFDVSRSSRVAGYVAGRQGRIPRRSCNTTDRLGSSFLQLGQIASRY